jgi:L-fucono-1,5-lactonase
MNIIDAHHHVWDLSVRDQDWIIEDAVTREVSGIGK